ncbi:conserved hypothetical protein [Ricinus communis]|uniref:Uncharacterized protein n=1 Tax=Ricinus communis TaxID=3988 RepID=B9T238_RICCO|nr:conserved hypothetical protein [Ricinus communis]
MAISTQRDSDRLLFKATRPHFFKIVLNDVIRDKKLVPIDLEEEFVEPRVEQVEKDAFVEILNAFSSSRKRKEKSPVSSGQPLKKKKLENPTRRYEANTGNGSMSVVVAKTQQLSSDQKAYLLKRARVAFNSKNPAFTLTLQSSYIHPGYQLNATCKKIIKGTYDEAANKLTENILQSGHQVRLAEAFPSGKIVDTL